MVHDHGGSKENDATSTAEAAATGHWRLWQQWWRQKQWDDKDGNNRQQSLQAMTVTMAGADNN
jgi:hypothetical protein